MANIRRIKTVVLLCVLALSPLIGLFAFSSIGKKTARPSYEQKTFFTGTSQEVAVHFITGDEPGPTFLIFGGIHGDEAAGYLAVERYTQISLKKGNLILVPRLNAVAIAKNRRQGLGGDMNRLFDLSEDKQRHNPDAKVVDLAKSLIQSADFVANLHQAYDFYNPKWISRQRNPSKWGQCNVIDTPIYHLPNGEKLEPGRFAQAVSRKSNLLIGNPKYHFLVNDTNTAGPNSRHEEQRGSLTFYALTKQHKIALGMEATKNCSLAEAVWFLTIAVNAALTEAGIEAYQLPSHDVRVIKADIKEGSAKTKTVSPRSRTS